MEVAFGKLPVMFSMISSGNQNGGANLMPVLLDAARRHVSEGEIVSALQQVWGDYREQPVF